MKADLDGMKKLSSAGINSNTIVLEDARTEHHKAGKNAIRLDGSFSQRGGNAQTPMLTPEEKRHLNQQLLAVITQGGISDADCLQRVKDLFKQGADGDYRDETEFSRNYTPLHSAIQYRHLETAKFITENVDVDVLNIGDFHDYTPLHSVLQSWGMGDAHTKAALNEIAKLLVDKGVDLTLQTSGMLFQTAWDLANILNNIEMKTYIEQAGGN